MGKLLIKRNFFLISCLLIVLCAAGCSFKFEIIPLELNTETPLFKFSKPIMSPPRGKATVVELNRFMILQKKSDSWDYEHPLWAFELPPGSALNVEQFRYGHTPLGYIESDKAKKLTLGIEYLAIGFGPGSAGSSEFSLLP